MCVLLPSGETRNYINIRKERSRLWDRSGTRTAMSSRKVITCEIMPFSILLNTPRDGSSQQSLLQEVASSMPVSSQNTLTSGKTPTFHTFPFGHCHYQLRAASLTLCKAWEYVSNHRELFTIPCTSSCIINCPMLRTVRAAGQTSCPWTLIFHCQMVRCLANERAAPLVPTISGVTRSYQGTSLSKMPWTTNCSQQVALQVGSTISSISSSSPMSIWYPDHCPGLPPECSSLPLAEDWQPSSSHHITRWTGVC